LQITVGVNLCERETQRLQITVGVNPCERETQRLQITVGVNPCERETQRLQITVGVNFCERTEEAALRGPAGPGEAGSLDPVAEGKRVRGCAQKFTI
jgi:hypothetical protein